MCRRHYSLLFNAKIQSKWRRKVLAVPDQSGTPIKKVDRVHRRDQHEFEREVEVGFQPSQKWGFLSPIFVVSL
jgi:hypothetical protein